MTSEQVQDFIHEIEQGDTGNELAGHARRFIYGVLASRFDDQTKRRIATALLGNRWSELTDMPMEG